MPPVIEGQIHATNMLQNVIPLSTLMEFIVQRTYHEMTVLSELLPRKTDLERKIEICQYANRTKQLFVRLLALVKWINSANKVEKCARISSFLQQQQMIFIETANMLSRMARETLVRARLPCFSLPCAVDVLTTGTYPRLPHCIRERIVPPELLPPAEKKKILSKLTQVIEYRIVTSELPTCMCKPSLDNGRVKFLVDHEFEVTLTLMGDSPNIPWRLLNIEILVEDHENSSSLSLVHPKQVGFLHEVVQMRLIESEQPLHDLYNCLHYFCQSLHLEVLHFQTMNLREKFGDNLKVEEYTPGKSLTLSYWRLMDFGKSKGKVFHQGFKLNIHVDEKKFGKPLQILHFPQILGADGVKCLKQINVACLSIEKVWTHTIQIRSIIKLKELKRELEVFLMLKCEITSVPPMISIQLVPPLQELAVISIDNLKGTFIVNLPDSVCSLREILMDSLNSDKKDLRHIIFDIRLQIIMKNYKRLIESSSLMLANHFDIVSFNENITRNIHIVKFSTTSKNRLVIWYDKESLDVKFHLHGECNLPGIDNNKSMVEVNPEVVQKWITMSSKDDSPVQEKDKLRFDDNNTSCAVKGFKSYENIFKELIFVHIYSEDILYFTNLSKELTRSNIANTGYQADPTGVGLLLILLNFPTIEGISESVESLLKASILSVSFRLFKKEKTCWSVEIIFTHCPFKWRDGVHRFMFSYEAGDMKNVVSSFVDDWMKVCHLHKVVVPFAKIYNDSLTKANVLPLTEVVSYDFNKLVLSYGLNNVFNVELFYVPKSKSFQLIFGTNMPSIISNCHSVVFSYLEHFFNGKKSLFLLCKVFEETFGLLSSISKLNSFPIMWSRKSSLSPVQAFTIIPQSVFHLKVFFQSIFCIDFYSSRNHVSLRDGSYSGLNLCQITEGISSISGFHMFLDSFMNDMQRLGTRLNKDDDLQPPLGAEQMDFSLSSTMNFMGHGSPLAHKLITSSPVQIIYPSGNPSPSTMYVQSPASVNQFVKQTFPGSRTTSAKLPLTNVHLRLSIESLNKLVSQLPGNGPSSGSPLDRFLGSVFFQKHLHKIFSSDDNFSQIISNEPGTLAVKSESSNLHLKFVMNSTMLHLKIASLQEPMGPWELDDLLVLENYFEIKVSTYPYKPTQLEAFCSLLKIQYHVLKDFIQILKLEMNPDKNLKWFIQLLLTLPYGTGLEYGLGSCALVVSRKIVFVLQFTRNPMHAANVEAASHAQAAIVASFCYDPITNYIQLVDSQKQVNSTISNIIKRFTDYSLKTNECCLFSSILDLINNL